jgi:hypothetical protein
MSEMGVRRDKAAFAAQSAIEAQWDIFPIGKLREGLGHLSMSRHLGCIWLTLIYREVVS